MATLSVFTPNYNGAATIARTIEAIVSQSRAPDEYLIIDDGSTDDSVRIIERYAARHAFIRFVDSKENRGVLARVNEGLESVSGTWFLSAASDDYLLPGFFARAMRLADEHPTAGVIFGPMIAETAGGRRMYVSDARRFHRTGYFAPQEFLTDYVEVEGPMTAAGATTIFRRDALRDAGGFPAALGPFSDGFMIRALGLSHGVGYIEAPCGVATVRNNSFSAGIRNDLPRLRAVGEQVALAMRSEKWRHVFPEPHVARFEQRWRFWALDDAGAINGDVVARELLALREAYFELAERGGVFDRVVARVHHLGRKLRRALLREG